jgi:hypothetical protein
MSGGDCGDCEPRKASGHLELALTTNNLPFVNLYTLYLYDSVNLCGVYLLSLVFPAVPFLDVFSSITAQYILRSYKRLPDE